MPPVGFFITGTDTGVGKTHVTCGLTKVMVQKGLRVGVYKPVCSGADETPDGRLYWSDIERLSAALPFSPPLEWVCPQRFLAPLAPPMAARLEGRKVDSRLLRSGLACWNNQADVVLVEGAGGWNSPIADGETVAHLARDLNFPVVIVAANRLGMVNHTLLTIESVRNSGLELSGVIVNTTQQRPDPSSETNVALLREMTETSIIGPIPWSEQNHLRPDSGLTTMVERLVRLQF